MIGLLVRRQTQEERSQMKKNQIRVITATNEDTSECRKPREARKSHTLKVAFAGNMALGTLGFWKQRLQNYERRSLDLSCFTVEKATISN